MSNVGALCADLVKHVKSIIIMGGAVLEKRGNRTPAAEANFASDPRMPPSKPRAPAHIRQSRRI